MRHAQPPVDVLFDRVCRENGVDHLLTHPHSHTTGKIERFHRTLRIEFDTRRAFASLTVAQHALDEWVPFLRHTAVASRCYRSRVKTKRRSKPRSVFSLPKTGYIRTTDALRNPKPAARLPQRKGESDKEYAARLDAAREAAYERMRRRRIALRAT